MPEYCKIDTDGRILTLTLNRLHVLNAATGTRTPIRDLSKRWAEIGVTRTAIPGLTGSRPGPSASRALPTPTPASV